MPEIIFSRIGDQVTGAVQAVLIPPARIAPIEWIESNINLGSDSTASSNENIVLDPWQRKPFEAQFEDNRLVVIEAIEQIGKSTLWRLPLIYRVIHDPSPCWIIYESTDKAEDINKRTFLPLLKSCREVRGLLNRLTARKDGYDLANGAILDFSGAGSDITSKPVKYGVADEFDRWCSYNYELTMQNFRNFQKRFRTYSANNTGCMTICSSPKNESRVQSPTHDIFKMSTAEYWTLGCFNCNQLTMRSCDIHHLQWEADEDNQVISGSITLTCPKCGREHSENESLEMNINGGYEQSNEKPKEKWKGFQIGSLGVPRIFRWMDIAEANLAAGRTADYMAQVDFANSWRGLPFFQKKSKDEIDELEKRYTTPLENTVNFIAVDVQDDRMYYIVRGIDAAENSYLKDSGDAFEWQQLTDKFYEWQCYGGIVDLGGHRGKETIDWLKNPENKRWFGYRGNSKIGSRWKISNESKRVILANPYVYQTQLLYSAYGAKPAERGNWYLNQNPSEMYLQQFTDMKPDQKKKYGHHYENWTGTGNDHLFDCEKMALILIEIYTQKERHTKKHIEQSS